MNNYSTEQLQKILDDAPDGAVWVACNVLTHPIFYDSYFRLRAPLGWCASGYHFKTLVADYKYVLKLSDIRAELQRRDDKRLVREFKDNLDSMTYYPKPEFKVGDRLVAISGDCDEIFTIDRKDRIGNFWDARWRMLHIELFRHATTEEEAAGHRIDEPEKMMTRESLLPPLRNTPVKFLNDEQLSELTKNTDFSSVAHVQLKHKPDTITTQLDPAKCRAVDPTVYDAPTDSPRDDFDAMSESHRSPSCKCHEWPLDVQIKPNAEDESMGLNHEHAQILVDQANEIIGLNNQFNNFSSLVKSLRNEFDLWAGDCPPVERAIELLEQALEGAQGE